MPRDGDDDTRTTEPRSALGKPALVLAATALIAGAWPMTAQGQDEGPPTGVYRCVLPKFNPFNGSLTFGPAGEFTLLPGGRYKGLPNDEGVGRYGYDPGTRVVEWLGGPLAEAGMTAKYTGLNSTGYTIKLAVRLANATRELWCHRRA